MMRIRIHIIDLKGKTAFFLFYFFWGGGKKVPPLPKYAPNNATVGSKIRSIKKDYFQLEKKTLKSFFL